MARIDGKRAHVRGLEARMLLRHALGDCRRQRCRRPGQARAAFGPAGSPGEPTARTARARLTGSAVRRRRLPARSFLPVDRVCRSARPRPNDGKRGKQATTRRRRLRGVALDGQRAYLAAYLAFSRSSSRRARREIFPAAVFGKASRISKSFGISIGDRRPDRKIRNSSASSAAPGRKL